MNESSEPAGVAVDRDVGPRRVKLSRAKGWRMPPGTVKVDRSSIWGNPFIVGRHGTRAECVRLHELLVIRGLVAVSCDNAKEQIAYVEMVRHNASLLRGRDLGCWCPLDAPCHADTLLRLANVGPNAK